MAVIGGREISFGLWYDFRNPEPWARPVEELYAQTFEHIRYAERLGFDAIWTSEHHFIGDGYSPSLLPICAAIAARTTRVRIGTNVLLLPLHDPVRIAEDAATVDIISGGRFDLGVAVGYKQEEFSGFDVDRRERATRMDEAIGVLRSAWAPGRFSFDGKHYRYHDIDVTPKPVQQPMPLWIGGFSEPAVKRAARLGDALLAAANVIPTYLAERERLAVRGPLRIALSLPWAMVSTDPEAAWASIREHVFYQHREYARWFTAAGMPLFPTIPGSPEDIRRRNPDIVVTPARAREIIERTVVSLPVTHLYWWAVPPGVAPKQTVRSLELISRLILS
ncbi:MAG: LLM class flavin-dependent oxidoreductase [Dehalococcoidia bacterium]|nr:LLM class flavin-dependent oxidoreductase [Dehalococcoidia bacterium]